MRLRIIVDIELDDPGAWMAEEIADDVVSDNPPWPFEIVSADWLEPDLRRPDFPSGQHKLASDVLDS